jgi:hypothetical protein
MPTAVRWIVALTRVRMAFAILVIVAAIYFASPADSEMLESFRRGWVRGTSGHEVETYGAAEAGEVAGSATIPIILSMFILTFVRRRNLNALRVAAAINLLVSVTQGGALPFAIATLVLAHLKSTREYMDGGRASSSSAPQRATGPRKPATTLP